MINDMYKNNISSIKKELDEKNICLLESFCTKNVTIQPPTIQAPLLKARLTYDKIELPKDIEQFVFEFFDDFYAYVFEMNQGSYSLMTQNPPQKLLIIDFAQFDSKGGGSCYFVQDEPIEVPVGFNQCVIAQNFSDYFFSYMNHYASKRTLIVVSSQELF